MLFFYFVTRKGDRIVIHTIDGSDKARLGRKIEKLLLLHPGRDLLHILRDLTTIKDEMMSLLDLPNHRLEYYLDDAIEKS
jgi:hypothetical protein